jgi:hypothetical protein
MRLERGWSETTNICREAGYLRWSWLMCWASCCFFLCSKCHDARTQLQIYSRTAKRLTFLQKVCNCVRTVWCSQCGSVFVVRSLNIAQRQIRSPPVVSGEFTYCPIFQEQWASEQGTFSAAKAATFHKRTAALNINSARRTTVRKQYQLLDVKFSLARKKSGYFKQFGITDNWGTSGKFTTNQSRKSVHGCTELALQNWISHCQLQWISVELLAM